MFNLFISIHFLQPMKQLTDPLTGETFFPKRQNQKFANSRNRIKFYNKKIIELRSSKSKYDKPLHRNYCILRDLLKVKQEVILHKQFLLGKGYNFTVFTDYKKKGDKLFPAVYGFIVQDIGNEQVKIFANE